MGERQKTNSTAQSWTRRTRSSKATTDTQLSAEQAEAEGVPLNREQRRVLKKRKRS